MRFSGKASDNKGPRSQPLVSVVTPVYNGAEYLAECIESVLGQTYQRWDYTIVDNCSNDGTREIALSYAALDTRIRVVENRQFLRAIPNHNVALRQISPQSKYCKIVFGDDWIFPRCLEEMVSIAEENPSVGIVGAYGLEEDTITCAGLPYPSRCVSGRQVCRQLFLEGSYVFGTSTSVLYRSDLVRTRDPFYNESNLHADEEACVVLLKTCDFSFVHQILTFKRMRPDSLTPFTQDFNTMIAGRLHTLVTHGRDFLSDDEFDRSLHMLLKSYYNFLAVSLMRGRRDRKFWDYHRGKLTATVGVFSGTRLAGAVAARLAKALLNLYETAEKLQEEKSRRKLPGIRPGDLVNSTATPVNGNGVAFLVRE